MSLACLWLLTICGSALLLLILMPHDEPGDEPGDDDFGDKWH